MRKAVTLDVRVLVEGNDAPAHDFAAASIDAVREILAAGASAHPELRVTVKAAKEH